MHDVNEPDPQSDEDVLAMSRRDVMLLGATMTGAAMFGLGSANAQMPTAHSVSPAAVVPLRLRVNGKPVDVIVDPRTSLLDLIREQLELTGTKKGCDHGQCGACTVHVDGRRVASCLTVAVTMQDRAVLTIEGLSSDDGRLHPMQQAFIDHDALQCGYCTPGQIMAAVACVQEGHTSSEAEIREYMSGNICRCGAYDGIVAAIQDAAAEMAGG